MGEKAVRELEFYLDILKNIEDLTDVKNVSSELSALVLILNELRQIHFHLDRIDYAVFKENQPR